MHHACIYCTFSDTCVRVRRPCLILLIRTWRTCVRAAPLHVCTTAQRLAELPRNLRTCLVRFHGRLLPESCQTLDFAPAPGVELPLEPLTASEGGGRATFSWLHPAPLTPPNRHPWVGPTDATVPTAIDRGGAGQGRVGGVGDDCNGVGKAPGGVRAGELAGSATQQICLGRGAPGRGGGGWRRAPRCG
jgi:hypothetical protein